jgi:uncharacterized protein YaiE (UPF0345 family)
MLKINEYFDWKCKSIGFNHTRRKGQLPVMEADRII